MSDFFLVLTLLSMLAFLVGIVFIFIRSKRRFSWKIILGSIVAFFACVAGLGISQDREARNLGFFDNQDMRRAREVGIASSAAWEPLRPQYQQLVIEKEKQAAVLRQQKDAEAAAQKAQSQSLAAAEKELRESEKTRASEEKARLEQEARVRAVAAKEEENKKCRSEISCWAEKHHISAGSRCRDLVERLAKNNFEWTDGWLEPKFSHFRWKDRDRGTVTYLGDRIKFQNGFGAWIIHVYECDYDPQLERVLAVRARPGRL